jgi:hypothetical protein
LAERRHPYIKLASIFREKTTIVVKEKLRNFRGNKHFPKAHSPAMLSHVQQGSRQRGRLSEQTWRDRFEVARRIRGRELELARLMAIISSIIPSAKKKETLVKLANKLAGTRGGPLLPRLELRNLPLMILWFADNHPAVFFCSCIDQLLEPDGENVDANPQARDGQADGADWFTNDEYGHDLMQDDGGTFESFGF